jgi:hypothetical protein
MSLSALAQGLHIVEPSWPVGPEAVPAIHCRLVDSESLAIGIVDRHKRAVPHGTTSQQCPSSPGRAFVMRDPGEAFSIYKKKSPV